MKYDPEYGELITDHFIPAEVPELSAGASAARLGNFKRWQIRILSDKPWIIQDAEEIHTNELRDVLARTGLLVHRTSWMVNGPNREVCWAVDEFKGSKDGSEGNWLNRISGKTTVPKRYGPPN